MKYKKILLIVFFLSLFIFQQAKAGATISLTDNQSQINSPANAPLDHIWVWVLHLVDPTGRVASPRTPCWTLGYDPSFGCGTGDPQSPQNPQNPIYIDVEQYYLPDVLPREMNVAEIYPTLAALRAQTLAARTVATWKAKYGFDGQYGYINNSTQYQVFIPGSYSTYTNPQDPVGVQQMISTAISSTSGQYLSYQDDVIDAEFGSDMENRTQTEHLNPGDPPVDPFVPKPYLTGIEDPVSTASCFNNSSGGHDYGMSQRGAIRWSKGNECPTGTGAAWPLTWNDYRQILVHYYTGIDILNSNGSKAAPDDRWNLLWHNIPSQTNPGQTIQANVWVQNTSTQPWTDAILGYQWVGPNGTSGWTEIPLSGLPAGEDENKSINITAPTSGIYTTLRLDVKRVANGVWFSEQAPLTWPDVRIPVQVNGTTATSTNTLVPVTPTFTPVCNPTSGPDPYADCVIDSRVNGNNNQYRDPSTVVGPPPANCSNWNQLSLGGGGGYVVVDMGAGEEIFDMAGEDLKVYEVGSGCNGVNQPYEVYVSNNPSGDWVFLGPGSGITVFDLNSAQTPLPSARYVKIIDNYATSHSSPSPGADIDAIEALNHALPASPTPATSAPTTFTPQSTSTPEPCDCPLEFLQELVCGSTASNDHPIVAFHRVSYNLQQALFDIQLFHRVEDEILSQTPKGQQYIDLYYGHGIEITELLMNNTSLKDEAIATIQLWEPNLQALVNGNGDAVTITGAQVQAIQSFLDHLYVSGSPELQQTIVSEQAATPLDQFIGQTMSQAWEEIGGIATSTPTNTSTATPSQTQTPTVTPAGGTVTFTPIADAYVHANNPAINYGSSTTLRVDASPMVRSYLRFDVQGLNGAVTRATLRMFANNASSEGYQVLDVNDNTWVENTINYNNAPPVGTVIGDSGTFGADVWTTVDVTNYITGDGVFNLALRTTSNTAFNLASRETGAKKPELVIETTGGTPPTATQTPTNTATHTPTATLTPTPPATGGAFYLSLSGQATLDGVAGEDIDILYYNGAAWSLFFDASDVGITGGGQDLNDFYIVDADTILLTFRDPITLGSLAVDPYDVVQFDATSLGNTTAGTFSMYFDGDDVGLDDPDDEMLDAFDVLPDGRLLFSTDSSFAVTGLSGKDEDIFAFTPTTLGDSTSGTWAMYFDGSISGMGLGDSGEDLDLLDITSNGDIYLSTENPFAVSGISGEDEDIFVCSPMYSSGVVSSCAYSSALFFDGSAWGLADNDVDGLYLP